MRMGSSGHPVGIAGKRLPVKQFDAGLAELARRRRFLLAMTCKRWQGRLRRTGGA
jgi:hypothetical protein